MPPKKEQRNARIRVGWNTEQATMGLVFPRWLGVADTAINRREVLVLPLPFNYLYALAIRIYINVRGFGGYRDRIYQSGVTRGYSNGYKDGFLNGTEEGVKKGREEFKDQLLESFDVLRKTNAP